MKTYTFELLFCFGGWLIKLHLGKFFWVKKWTKKHLKYLVTVLPEAFREYLKKNWLHSHQLPSNSWLCPFAVSTFHSRNLLMAVFWISSLLPHLILFLFWLSYLYHPRKLMAPYSSKHVRRSTRPWKFLMISFLILFRLFHIYSMHVDLA